MTVGPRRRCVVITEADGPGQTLAARVVEAGFDVRMFPVVAHGPATDPAPLADALARLSEFDWVTFTSARAVDGVCACTEWSQWPWRTAQRPRIAAVGPVTRAALVAHAVPVSLYPENPGARELAEALINAEGGSLAGRSVLWPRSNIARPDLGHALRAAGASVVEHVAYCTTAVLPLNLADTLRDLEAGRIDCVAFFSPSGAANLAAVMPGGTLAAWANRTIVASVGPTTSAALAHLGAPAAVEAESRTAGGLADALLNYFGLHEGNPP